MSRRHINRDISEQNLDYSKQYTLLHKGKIVEDKIEIIFQQVPENENIISAVEPPVTTNTPEVISEQEVIPEVTQNITSDNVEIQQELDQQATEKKSKLKKKTKQE